MTLKSQIKEQAAEDIGIALAKLRTYIREESADFNDCILFERRVRKLKRERLRGTESGKDLDFKENKLLVDGIEFVDEIAIDTELVEKISEEAKKDVFYEKIAIYCSEEKVEYMRQFFSRHYFTREQREKNIIKKSIKNNGLEKQNFCFIEKW